VQLRLINSTPAPVRATTSRGSEVNTKHATIIEVTASPFAVCQRLSSTTSLDSIVAAAGSGALARWARYCHRIKNQVAPSPNRTGGAATLIGNPQNNAIGATLHLSIYRVPAGGRRRRFCSDSAPPGS